MDESAAQTRVEWHEWGPDAFELAAEEGKPILLSLSATWCSHCHEMDRETYDEPRIAANVNDGFVPVRVDVDRNPRVRDRYNMGGFPSNVFLTPDGEVLTGSGYLGEDGMRQVIDSVRRMWDEKGAAAGRVPRSVQDNDTPAGELTEDIEIQLLGQIRESYDERNGGWGSAEKFPMPRTIEFALKREQEQALRSLNAVSANLLDDYAGGFFRFAANPDWSGTHHEKLLDTNASLLRAFANAYLYTGKDEYRQPAEATVDYLTGTLWNGDAFGGGQAAGAGASYYTAEPSDRESAETPTVDETAFADWNALAVDALLTYHAYTDDETARRYAERTLDYLTAELVDDGVVTHFRADDGTEGEAGLLVDHARVLSALTRAREVLGADTLDTAQAVADHAIDTLLVGDSFVDGPREGLGLLDRPLRPLDGNVEFADALLDLALLTGEDEYREVAADALAAFAGAADRFGVRIAAYGSAVSRLLYDPLVIAVTDEPGSDLHRAALRMADHEKVVVPNATGYAESGAAYVVRGESVADPAYDPETLSRRVSDAME
ncbi:DUF255 domain-containing protein [Haloarchaeobius sp. HME9146]|uniref:DUF255 domain-containing protein n=1 Tax=Haloarchaeobius sp. HME9146 TaxID=2978732 RepID=UPI0021C0D6EE|nr:DUF255 domain-containing protein [Haloarchaeobius sp. HME9146]MCT9097806.1 DUF255 domain-containing protein [Haloarchaeobius sp. HME9146]